MRDSLSDFDRSGASKLQRIVDNFLAQPGLPFASVLSAERIERVFRRHGNLFGVEAVYSTSLMVWSFLGQVLRDGKEASCQAAVARVVVHQQHSGGTVPTSDTGEDDPVNFVPDSIATLRDRQWESGCGQCNRRRVNDATRSEFGAEKIKCEVALGGGRAIGVRPGRGPRDFCATGHR